MTEYVAPDALQPFGYQKQGRLRALPVGDFFKCGMCHRYTRHDGTFWACQQMADTIWLSCPRCRADAPGCWRWDPSWPHGQKTG